MGKLTFIILFMAQLAAYGQVRTISPYMEMVLRAPNSADARRRLEITGGAAVPPGYSTNRWTTNADSALINGGTLTNAVDLTAGANIHVTPDVTHRTWDISVYGVVLPADLADATNGYYRNRFTTNADGVIINGGTLTNTVNLIPGTGMAIVTNTPLINRVFTLSVETNVVGVLTNFATSHPWIQNDDIDDDHTDVLVSVTVPATDTYTVNFMEYTLVAATGVSIDSLSWIYVLWTDPETSTARQTDLVNANWATYGAAYVPIYAPLVFRCKGGTSLTVSNFWRDSFYGPDSDKPSTNFVSASIWGRLR